jgi:hypothetical protein
MKQRTLIAAALLVLLGTGGIILGRESGPGVAAFFGLALLAVALPMEDGREKLLGTVAAILALLGMVGTAAYVPKAFEVLAGHAQEHSARVVVLASMAVVCLVYGTLSIRHLVRIFMVPHSTDEQK